MKKKIIFFLYDLSRGGAEQVIVRLSNYLTNKGYKVEILIIGSINLFSEDIDKNVKLTSLKLDKIHKSFLPLIRFSRNNNFDFFVSNVWPVTVISVMAFLFTPSLLKKLILIEHNPVNQPYRKKNFIFRSLQNQTIRILYNLSNRVITVSKGIKEDLIRKGLNENKGLVIYNPAYPEKKVPKVETTKKISLWTKGEHIKLISVGNLKAQKNYPSLIKAINILKNEKKINCRLMIVGEGPERERIENLINEYDLFTEVILFGRSYDPLSLIKHADIFILASDFEGFGLVIVEALSVGKTVVSTDCFSGPAEIIRDNEFGYLCEVNDPLDLAEKTEFAIFNQIDPDYLKIRAKDFTIQKIGPKYEDVFTKKGFN